MGRSFVLVMLTGLIGLACCKRDARRGEDADMPSPALAPRWIEGLMGAAEAVAVGDTVLAQWWPVMSSEPAPPLIERLEIGSGKVIASDRGWLMRPGDPALVIDESDQALGYVVRGFGETGGVALPAPDAAPWPLRAAVCGARVERCAVVRWSARPGEPVAVGGTERISIAVIDARTRAVERTIDYQAASYSGGGASTGDAVANPIRPELYLLERGDAAGQLRVRAVDLATGEVRWHTTIDKPPGSDPMHEDGAELIVTGDGRHVVVAQGDFRWQYLNLARLTVLDSDAGAVRHALDEPSGYGFLVTVPDRPELLIVRIAAIRGGGESPTYSFLGVSRLDPSIGRVAEVYDPAAGVHGDDDREEARRITPQGGVAIDGSVLLLYRHGLRQPYVEDVTPPERQQARDAAVGAMLAD